MSDYFIYQQYVSSNAQQNDTREQLRAVVSFAGGIATPANIINDNPNFYAFLPRFHNYGSTRTSEFEAWDSIHYFEKAVPNSQDFSKPWEAIGPLKNSIIPPNSDAYLSPVTITPAEAASVLEGKGLIVIWGHANWADIFEKKKEESIFVFQ